MHAFYTKLNIALAGRSHAVLLALVGVALVFFVVGTLRAWRDVVKLDKEQYRHLGQQMLRPMMERLAPQDEIAIRVLRLNLVRAGLRDEHAVERYVMLRMWALGAAALLTLGLVISGQDALHVLVVGGIFLAAAYKYPDFYVRGRMEKRQQQIGRALPSVIDLMVLCLDVGLSIEASFERVTMEMRSLEPLMAEEASVMLGEMGGGINFPQALKRMADRIGYEDLMTLARLISQASQMGASLSRALREYSDAAFQKRMIGLEEKAGKISSMMVLPVTLCMLPAALIALVAPAVLILVNVFQRV